MSILSTTSTNKLLNWYKNTVWPELTACVAMWNIAFFSVHITNSVFILGQALASIPLFCFLLAKIMLFAKHPKKKLIVVGATWGTLCLGMQTAWFVLLHFYFPKYYPAKLLVVWLGAVLMFAILGACFSILAFFLCKRTKNFINRRRASELGTFTSLLLFSCLTLALWNPFYWYLTNASFWPTSKILGYPFFSPMLPLESSRKSIFDSFSLNSNIVFRWIEPTTYKRSLKFDHTIEFDPYRAGKEVAKQLLTAQSEISALEKTKKVVLMAPESTFPFYINHFQEIIELWAGCLEANTTFLIGAYRKEAGNSYQCTAVISPKGLEKLLDKKFLTPFAEARFTPGANIRIPNIIYINPEHRLQSIICFEFFSNPWIIKGRDKNLIPVIFGNDSWYPKYFKVLLHNFAKLMSRKNKKPIIYLSHEKSLCLGPLS